MNVGFLLFLFAVIPVLCSAAPGNPPPADKGAYTDFAMHNDGDPARGRKLFEDENKTLCSRCHSVDGSSSKAGPDLAFVGDTNPRRELIRALLEPSAAIAVGYGSTL